MTTHFFTDSTHLPTKMWWGCILCFIEIRQLPKLQNVVPGNTSQVIPIVEIKKLHQTANNILKLAFLRLTHADLYGMRIVTTVSVGTVHAFLINTFSN